MWPPQFAQFLKCLDSNKETPGAGFELRRLTSFAVGDLLSNGGTLTEITFCWRGEEANEARFANVDLLRDVFDPQQATNVKTITNPMTLLQDTPDTLQPPVVDFMVSFSVDIVDEHVLTAFNSETLTQHCSEMLSNIDRGIQLDYADVSSVLEGPL